VSDYIVLSYISVRLAACLCLALSTE